MTFDMKSKRPLDTPNRFVKSNHKRYNRGIFLRFTLLLRKYIFCSHSSAVEVGKIKRWLVQYPQPDLLNNGGVGSQYYLYFKTI